MKQFIRLSFLLPSILYGAANSLIAGLESPMHFAAGVGDKISLYDDRLGDNNMYGFGMESNAMYYKANHTHRWYVGVNADGGSSDKMELSASRLFIDGNVGIGTASPTRKLEVVGHTRLSLLEVRDSSDSRIDITPLSGANNRESVLRFGATFDSVPQDTGTRLVANIHAGFNGGAWNTEFLSFGVGGAGDAWNPPTERMRITAAGNVGIGEVSPSNKLEVNGTIRSKEVIVESTGWSDFVFEDGYDLPSLDEVSSFIDKNGHLPDIPSAEEVAENGITLGEMNAKLLQKVEELTLYVLQLSAQNQQFRQELNQLKSNSDFPIKNQMP